MIGALLVLAFALVFACGLYIGGDGVYVDERGRPRW